jgi:enoyl-CoA hydratase/carnithine racemase
MPYRADRRLYHTADKSRVVEEGDPEAAFLYLAEGQSAPLAEAREYGLVSGDEPDNNEGAPDAAQPVEQVEPEAKAVVKAPANKAVGGPKEQK